MLSGSNITQVIHLSPEELKKFLDENIAQERLRAFINRFEGVLIDTAMLAKIHRVNPRTVLNYVNDGLIEPEDRVFDNDHPRFRLSYALTLDFKELRRQLRFKNKGW